MEMSFRLLKFLTLFSNLNENPGKRNTRIKENIDYLKIRNNNVSM